VSYKENPVYAVREVITVHEEPCETYTVWSKCGFLVSHSVVNILTTGFQHVVIVRNWDTQKDSSFGVLYGNIVGSWMLLRVAFGGIRLTEENEGYVQTAFDRSTAS
jgi:uncharacterized membrane protein